MTPRPVPSPVRRTSWRTLGARAVVLALVVLVGRWSHWVVSDALTDDFALPATTTITRRVLLRAPAAYCLQLTTSPSVAPASGGDDDPPRLADWSLTRVRSGEVAVLGRGGCLDGAPAGATRTGHFADLPPGRYVLAATVVVGGPPRPGRTGRISLGYDSKGSDLPTSMQVAWFVMLLEWPAIVGVALWLGAAALRLAAAWWRSHAARPA